MDAQSKTGNSLFERTGKIICGDRFVGRKHEINEIKQHVIDNRANVAIVGMPRIGKSSLAWQSLMYVKESLIRDKQLIPIYMPVNTINSNISFFRGMVNHAIRELDKIFKNNVIDCITEEDFKTLSESCQSCVQIEDGKIDDKSFYAFYEDFYQLTGCKLVYIFDEFDKVQNIFHAADFMLLRETAYTPDTNLSYLTISRKSIREIETIDKINLSNFHGTFNKYIYLNVFSDEDVASYWKRIKSATNFSEEIIKNITSISGNHPLLLDLCCLEQLSNPNVPLLESANLREKLYHEFDQIIEMFEEKDLLTTAKKVIIGPPMSIDTQKKDILVDFGFLRIISSKQKSEILSTAFMNTVEDSYVLFSDYFSQLFYFKYFLDIDYWPLWSNTEKKMRELIKRYISVTYSNNWEAEIYAKYGDSANWADRFDLLISTRSKNQRLFPNASSDLIDYTLTSDMYETFMSKAWNDWFCHVFPGRQKDWAAKFIFLAQIRNPMAHNNREFISQDQKVKATDYCNEILRVIGEWEAKQE